MQTVEKIAKTLASRMKELRKLRGITQEQLAERAGMASISISLIETCRQWPGVESIASIAKALDVPETALFQSKEVTIRVTGRDVLRYFRDAVNDPDVFEDLAMVLSTLARKAPDA